MSLDMPPTPPVCLSSPPGLVRRSDEHPAQRITLSERLGLRLETNSCQEIRYFFGSVMRQSILPGYYRKRKHLCQCYLKPCELGQAFLVPGSPSSRPVGAPARSVKNAHKHPGPQWFCGGLSSAQACADMSKTADSSCSWGPSSVQGRMDAARNWEALPNRGVLSEQQSLV